MNITYEDDNKVIVESLKRNFERMSDKREESIRDTSFLDKDRGYIGCDADDYKEQKTLKKYKIDVFKF